MESGTIKCLVGSLMFLLISVDVTLQQSMKYDCTTPRTVTICEGTAAVFECTAATGTSVTLAQATYGRSDTTSCPMATADTIMCTSNAAQVLSQVQARCTGKSRCKLYSGNEYLGYTKTSHPCKDTHKYLTVTCSCA